MKQHFSGVVGAFTTTLLQIFPKVLWRKNSENQSMFGGEITTKSW